MNHVRILGFSLFALAAVSCKPRDFNSDKANVQAADNSPVITSQGIPYHTSYDLNQLGTMNYDPPKGGTLYPGAEDRICSHRSVKNQRGILVEVDVSGLVVAESQLTCSTGGGGEGGENASLSCNATSRLNEGKGGFTTVKSNDGYANLRAGGFAPNQEGKDKPRIATAANGVKINVYPHHEMNMPSGWTGVKLKKVWITWPRQPSFKACPEVQQ